MKISAILLARTLAFVDLNELNPRGTVFVPSLVPALVERFKFQKFPTKLEDFDEANGVTFASGYFEGQTIQDLTFYSDGIKLDVRSSTEQGHSILVKTLEWLASSHGVSYGKDSISRWNYVSNISFNSEIDLDFINPVLMALTLRLSEEMKNDRRVTDGFHVESLSIDLDRTYGAKQIAPFNIQRLSKTDFKEGKYFSAAPLPTATHISILEEFEAALKAQIKI